MPAGFDHTVLASSAAAAPPAKALPIALPEFSCSANPAPDAYPLATDDQRNAAQRGGNARAPDESRLHFVKPPCCSNDANIR